MEQSRTIGMALMAVAALQMAVFTIGVFRRSYAAIALPMMGAMGAVSGLLFWVGYTMTSVEVDLTDLDLDDGDAFEASA